MSQDHRDGRLGESSPLEGVTGRAVTSAVEGEQAQEQRCRQRGVTGDSVQRGRGDHAAVVHEPTEGPLDDPAQRDDLQALLAGAAAGDLDVDAEGGAVVDGLGPVAVGGSGLGYAGVGLGET